MFSFKSEEYLVEEEGKKNEEPAKTMRFNKQKLAKKKRDLGQEYIRPKTGVVVAERQLQPRCNGIQCQKLHRLCCLIDEEERKRIFREFNELGDLTRQRDFIARHIETTETFQRTSKKEQSRRQNTNKYYFTSGVDRRVVCKTFFLHTLGISESAMRTALKKLTPSGMEAEKRGGRQSVLAIKRDLKIRADIRNHIERFPKMESHYERSSSSTKNLHPELTIAKMHAMFVAEMDFNEKAPCISLYRQVFRSMNLSFEAKKDQCPLCMTYIKGDEAAKEKLNERFEKYTAEKNRVRTVQQNIKEEPVSNDNLVWQPN